MMAAAMILTARLGTINFQGHKETYYNLPMKRIEARANEYYGLENVFAIREDGVKTYNGFVIVAANWEVHPFGSVIETSRGVGLVLDHTTTDKETIDIATNW